MNVEQAASFAFTPENEAEADKAVARYPEGRQASAVLALLDIAQRQCGGWLPRVAMDHVAERLSMAPIRVYEVVTFYEMYYDRPRGTHEVRVCTTTPCWLRGSADLVKTCEAELGIRVGETTEDGQYSLSEFECLGACVNAPIVWIDDDYYEDLDPEKLKAVLDAFKRGEAPKPGSQSGRQTSAPAPGLTTLTAKTAKEAR
ncbi:MAG: NADH-quinone oxidoreductase subunit NuoE [Alphaproteobacteria bacterium]|nr:NADH-quinone oxidoreductase subunit NuoE [Alphaproteobacteria bacterium]